MGPLKPNSYKIIGMQRDNSTSAFDSRFSFENKNIRITSTKDNTQLSIVNERGTRLITVKEIASPTSDLVILGTPIGYNIIDNELILFTTENNSEPTQSIDLRNYYKLSTFTIHTEDDILTINYDIDAVQNEDITINAGLNIKVIINIVDDNQTISKYELTKTAKSGELCLYLPSNYALVSINKVYVYYASDINDLLHTNKLLYADYINKTIERLEDVDVYKPIVHESILGLLNNKFPFYISLETEFSNSTAVEPLITEQLDMINGYTTREYERINSNIITVVPDSYHTSDYNLYRFNTTTDTLDKISRALITTVNLISYNVVHFYRLKEIIDTTPINALTGIFIPYFPPVIQPQSAYSFIVSLENTGEFNLVNKAITAYFNRPGIRVTTIEFDNETKTYTINFQTEFLVSSEPITLTVFSNRYPNVNCSLTFSIRNVFLHDYQTTVSNVFTVISDGTKSNELPSGFNGTVTENIPTVSSITQPTYSTGGIKITNVNNVFTIEPASTTINGYRLDYATFTYNNGVFKQVIVEQIGINPSPSTAIIINNEEVSTPSYTPGELFTIQVYATLANTYSGPIVPTYNESIFQLVDHCAMIQTISGKKHIVHYFTFKVLSHSESPNTITFSIAPKEYTYTTSIDITTNNLPIVVEPKSISILKDNDFEIVLNESFNLTGILYPSNVDADKNTINLIGEHLEITETNGTLFTSKINDVPTRQYLTMYSTYDETIYKEITYQIVKPYIHIITNNGIVLDEIYEIVFDSSGNIETIYLDRTGDEDIKLNQDLVNEIESISIISNCETRLTIPGPIEWFNITQDNTTILGTTFIGECLDCKLFCKDDIIVERLTVLSVNALNNNTINFDIKITQTV